MTRRKYWRKNKAEQLCWSCAKACDDSLCEWVRRCCGVQEEMRHNDYPDYVRTVVKVKNRYRRGLLIKTAEAELISECDLYEWDGRSK